MCDYSLESLESRPAKVGDRLISTVFTNSITRGLASPDALSVAVCLRPGTKLAFNADIECEEMHFFPARKFTGMRTAIFRQFNMHMPHQYHDKLELPNGRFVLLTYLVPGQFVTVLQVPVEEPVAEPKPESIPEAPTEPAPELPKVGGEGAGGYAMIWREYKTAMPYVFSREEV